jgi:hypothetical protein
MPVLSNPICCGCAPNTVLAPFALCRQAEARSALSVSGAKAKQRADRQDARLAQAVFQRRERS